MANTFNSNEVNNITDETEVYKCPDNTVATVIGLNIANVSGNSTKVDVKKNTTHIVKQAPIPEGGALVAVGAEQKMVIKAGESIKVSADNAVDVVVSVLEIS